MHFHKFDPKVASPKSLEYLLFGNGTELFLAHSIVKPPDFDQIISVKLSGLTLSPSDLQTAMRLSIPLKKNAPTDRLREGEEAVAEMADGRKLKVQAVREFYFEEGELMMPATFDDTAEERKSGFPLRWAGTQRKNSKAGLGGKCGYTAHALPRLHKLQPTR